jgi:hypothetical protein
MVLTIASRGNSGQCYCRLAPVFILFRTVRTMNHGSVVLLAIHSQFFLERCPSQVVADRKSWGIASIIGLLAVVCLIVGFPDM